MDDAPRQDLDFEHAQFEVAPPSATACTRCSRPLDGRYFSVNGRGVCEDCLGALKSGQHGSFFKALLLGIGAGIVGASISLAIYAKWQRNYGLIALVVGVMVGKAVRKGAGASQSIVYRLLAIGLTWIAMCSTYLPMLASEMAKGDDGGVGAAGWILASVLAIGVPYFLLTDMQVMGLIIFGIGLWEAWRLSAPAPFEIAGPFDATTDPAHVPVPAPATE